MTPEPFREDETPTRYVVSWRAYGTHNDLTFEDGDRAKCFYERKVGSSGATDVLLEVSQARATYTPRPPSAS